jgi:hypothetical protein
MRARTNRARVDGLRTELHGLWTAPKFDHDAILRVVDTLKEELGRTHGKRRRGWDGVLKLSTLTWVIRPALRPHY